MEHKLEINIEDYLTIDEIKNIIRDEFAASVAKTLSKETDLTRIIGNIAHEIVFDEVGKYIPNYKELLAKNIKQIIEKQDYRWQIFRGKDVWDREEGPGLTIIKETLNANKDTIKKRIEAGEVFLVRCPKCGRENYALNVTLGICTWCGYNANDHKEELGLMEPKKEGGEQ